MARPKQAQDVPVEPLREAFERSGLTANEVARRAGWLKRYVGRRGQITRVADSTRVRRDLGITATQGGWFRTHVSYEEAVALVRAMDVDPVDCDV